MLTFEKGERLTVGQIAEVSTLSRPAVSHHLKILRAAGVLEAEKVEGGLAERLDEQPDAPLARIDLGLGPDQQ